MDENELESPRKILGRLEKLRQWQEEQEKTLIEKQCKQRKLLAQEQDKLYKMLGHSQFPDAGSSEKGGIDGEFIERLSGENMMSALIAKSRQEVQKRSPINKKPFLKRGEGLTSRFRVHPDHFNLKNIPKCKNPPGKRKIKLTNLQQTEVPANVQEVLDDSEKPPADGEVSANILDPQCWKKLLEAMNLNPDNASRLFQEFAKFTLNNSTESSSSKKSCDLDNLSLFELLEEKLQNSSLSSNSSTVRRLLKYDENKEQSTNDHCPQDTEGFKALPQSSDDEETENSGDEVQIRKPQVRFSEQVEVNQLSDTSDDDQDGNMVSTPQRSHDEFLNFKSNLEKKLSRFSDSGSEGDSREDLLVKRSDEIKARLKELEEEIDKFRKQNHSLTKEKQMHELAKVELENRRLEMEDQLNDERIKMEIYFHDERMKIADDKARYEKMLKDFKVPTKKEREEVKKLKERVEELEKELKEKITRHGAAQSRHRSQIRGLEKEIKEQGSEIEQLKKENRKLEAENVRLRRQSNNKTLQEIKRNIAKLAPPSIPPVQDTHGQKNRKSSPARRKESSKSMQMDEFFFSSDLENESSDEDVAEEPRKLEMKSEMPTGITNGSSEVKPTQQVDLKREIVNSDGSRDIWYPNGNLKKISADGMLIRMLYYNKDIKETDFNAGTVKYYYAENNTWHTSYLDGLEIYEYPNGETKHLHKDGTTEIHFPNGAVLTKKPQNDGEIHEEWQYVDGTQICRKNGEIIYTFPNGQREIHSSDHKRREYPDGTVKFVYNDGSQETRYSNGRVRLKDRNGKLVMDSDTKSHRCDS
ncbi:centromere protein J [Lutzomyia longipalpis]|uniref:centromere protein J n=1 Tax=Lutzomyia longipalpis TaxID=7200 RepID=UPI0024833801|nr:centromere protein J [Lutzomyia longipalpis]